jgi:hypothetical protein
VKGTGGHNPFLLFHIGYREISAGQMVQRLQPAAEIESTAHTQKPPKTEKNRSGTAYRFDS